jgi:hypothetical protein
MKLKKKWFEATTAKDYSPFRMRAYDCVNCISLTCERDHSTYAYMTVALSIALIRKVLPVNIVGTSAL